MLTALIVAVSLGQCPGGVCYAPARPAPVVSAPAYGYRYAQPVAYPSYRTYQPAYTYRVYAPAPTPRVLYSTPWGAGSCYGGRCR